MQRATERLQTGVELADLYNKCSKQPLQWTGQRELGHVHTTEQRVTVIHEHVILGSAGFWDLLSVDDAVLRSHFFVKVRNRPSECNVACTFPSTFIDEFHAVGCAMQATSLAALDVSCNPEGEECQANVAAHLTQYARGKHGKRQAV